MPLRNWLFRINDILDAVSAVETYVTGMTYEDFVADRILWDTVQIDLPPLMPVLKEVAEKYSKGN